MVIKKVIKKKALTTKKKKKKLETKIRVADDAQRDFDDEDFEVADLSNIPAPVIEFELPCMNSTKNGAEKEEGTDEAGKEQKEKASAPRAPKAKKSKLAKNSSKKEPLTAQKLNNELIELRKIVEIAKTRVSHKIVRRRKVFEGKLEKNATKKHEFERKIARLSEEALNIKNVDKDTVAKFALVNRKSFDELRIDGTTPVAQRLLYKLACEDVVVKMVDGMRAKYSDWDTSVAFYLQRLGLQYAGNKKEQKEMEAIGVEVEEEEPKIETDDEQDDDEETYVTSDVEMVNSDEEEEAKAAENRRKILLGLINAKVDETRPALKPKKRKIEEADEPRVSTLKKPKEELKNEAKKILESVIQEAEVKKPKKVLKKKGEKKKKVKEELAVVEKPSTAVIKTINLSDGGVIEKVEKTVRAVEKPKVLEEEEGEDDDDPAAKFFLPNKDLKPKRPKNVEKKEVAEMKKKGASKKKKSAVEKGEVHPSWAASMQKKKEMQSAKPCGKKIVFDDDD
ncbi:unnamed protein product [Caenorhabditis bovis]|uniref:SRF-dependent transcription regulation-associated protein n=1 Tax=Caenorhabditis bovis TaxID=2654633 RepID=A0A8S1FCX8_9PELO|nr:unnamed protein product [Caenorhabditis bovis]